ncbi:MAG: hypothetical protein OXF47_06810 [Nitrospira sp.]|nr:hypothetical protein [Nitrospira sp.]
MPPKLTYENQGYWDRRDRAESWISRAESPKEQNLKEQEWDDDHDPFIFYWIAFNALYGQHDDIREKLDSKDIQKFLKRIYELDQEDGSLSGILRNLKSKTDRLLNDQFLSKIYWKEGRSTHFKQKQKKDSEKARNACEKGKWDEYLIILFERLRVLRNQIFHGCSTDKKSLNKNSLRPALEILEKLVPQFLKIFRERGQSYDWGKVPYPRKGSPQHPK